MARAKKKKVYVEETIVVDNTECHLKDVSFNDRGTIADISEKLEDFVRDLDKGEISKDVLVQRTEGQWTGKQKSALMVSIIKGRPIGTILVTDGRWNKEGKYCDSLIDGLQRSTTIADFIHDGFKLSKGTEEILCDYQNETGEVYESKINIDGLKFSQLPEVIQKRILKYKVHIDEYRGYTDEELDEIIFCVNNGTRFKPNQKVRAMLGTKVMRKLQPLTESDFWSKVQKVNAKNDTILACVVRSLMLTIRHDWESISTDKMSAFAENFCDEPDYEAIDRITKYYDIVFKTTDYLSDDAIKLLDGCVVPHLTYLLEMFEKDYDITPELLARFINEFAVSYDIPDFNRVSKDLGSGAKLYDMDNVDARQNILRDSFELFLLDREQDGSITKKEVQEDDDNGAVTDEFDLVEDKGYSEDTAVKHSEYVEEGQGTGESSEECEEPSMEQSDDTGLSEDN